MLGIADQKGTVYLDVVDKDQVFVVVAAANIVLGTQLVGGVRSRQHLDDGLHAAAGRGHLETQFGVDRDVTMVVFRSYGDHVQLTGHGGKHDGDVERLRRLQPHRDDGVFIAELLE